MAQAKKIKVVITLLGERKITKLIDKEAETFIPKCGKSYLVTEKNANFLINNKYAKACEVVKAKKTSKK